MKITLNEQECQICAILAKSRFDNNRSAGVKNNKIGKQSNEFTDLEGISAELAFCKLFNVYPDFSVYTRSAKEDRGDVILNGKTIDVKATKYKTGKLLAVKWKKNADYYALMVGQSPEYTFKGFMASQDLLVEKRLIDLGYGPTYAAEQYELIRDLKE